MQHRRLNAPGRVLAIDTKGKDVGPLPLLVNDEPTGTATFASPDNLACATQLEADVALREWQHNRPLPPEQRLRDFDENARLRAYESTLDLVRRMVA